MKNAKKAVEASRSLQCLIAAVAEITPATVQRWAMSVGVTPRMEKKIEAAIAQARYVRGGDGVLGDFAKLGGSK